MSVQTVQDLQARLDTVPYFYLKLGLAALAAHPPERRWLDVPKFHYKYIHIITQQKIELKIVELFIR